MPSPLVRRAVPVVLGLSLAGSLLQLPACFVNAGPPNPHKNPEGDTPDPPDAEPPLDAAEEPG